MESTSRVRAPGAGWFIAVFVSCLFLSGFHLRATEADGRFRIRSAWVNGGPVADAAGSTTTLQITLEAVVPLNGVIVMASFPEEFTARVMTPPWDATSDHDPGSSIMLGIGDLESHATRRIELELTRIRAGGDFASIVATATGVDGRPVREALGIPCGRFVGKARPRNGAVEYPAGRPR